MSYLYWKQPYRRKPGRYLRPDFGHSQLRNCVYWSPLTEHGAPNARNIIDGTTSDFINGVQWDGNDVEQDGGASSRYIGLTNVESGLFDDEATLILTLRLRAHTPTVQADSGLSYLGSSTADNHYPYTNGSIYLGDFTSSRFLLGNIGIADRTQWHQVSITTKPGSSNWKFYQNATEYYSNTGPSSVSFGASKYIGRSVKPRYLDGWIRDARLYNRALSQAELSAVYNDPWAPFERRIWVPVSVVTAPTGTGTITLGISTLASQAVMEPDGNGVLDLDDTILNASGSSVLEPTGSGVLSLDEAILLASGLHEIPGTAALTLSDIVLAASGAQDIPGTATVSLSEVLVDAQGAQEYIATAAPILSTTVLDADGNAAVAPDGTGTLVLDSTTLAGTGVQSIPGTGTVLLETVVLNASGFSGAPEGTGTLVLDQTALDAQAVMLPDGSAAIVLDLVVLAAQGLGPAPEVTGGPWIIYARRRGRR